jgi:hypothetical protein
VFGDEDLDETGPVVALAAVLRARELSPFEGVFVVLGVPSAHPFLGINSGAFLRNHEFGRDAMRNLGSTELAFEHEHSD